MKPIFLVRIPNSIGPDDCGRTMDSLIEKLTDYHVLFVYSDIKEYAFECFLATEEDKTIIEKLTKELNEK